MPLLRFKVYGLIATALFQKCTECAEYLNKSYEGEFSIEVVKEMPRDVEDRKKVLLASGKLSRVKVTREEIQRNMQVEDKDNDNKKAGNDDDNRTLPDGPLLFVSGHHLAVMNAEVLVVLEGEESSCETGARPEAKKVAGMPVGSEATGPLSTAQGGAGCGAARSISLNAKKEGAQQGVGLERGAGGGAGDIVEATRIEEDVRLPGEVPTAQSGEAFLVYIQEVTTFRILSIDLSHPDSYANRALFSWKKFLHDRGNSYCWLSVKIGERDAGKITLELFSQMLPRTSTNFWRMCCGRGGHVVPEGEEDPVVLHYKGTTFFRILKGAWIMGGDVSNGYTGTGGYSCYGRHFPDESFAIPHNDAGILGMCNDGEHSNASSFYITMKKMSWMNGKYVAFGRVVDGMKTVEEIHSQPVKHNQSPEVKITIEDCGVLDVSM